MSSSVRHVVFWRGVRGRRRGFPGRYILVPASVMSGLLLGPAAPSEASATPSAETGVAFHVGEAIALRSAVTTPRADTVAASPVARHYGGGRILALNASESPERPLLQRGSRGPYVKIVQRRLGVAVDGIYGPVTEQAVVRFQRRQELLVDGIVGPQTWAALDRVFEGGSSGGGGRQPSGGASSPVDYAYAQLDDPYAYGAAGPSAFDCSGLTMMAWRQAGVDLPHSSSGQADHGTPVGWSQLRPGDLLFFYSPISHVGIYVGAGKMIAASNPEDDVELVNIKSSYWRENFTTARRY